MLYSTLPALTAGVVWIAFARAGVIASFPVSGMKEIRAFLLTHSSLAAEFGRQIGLDQASCDALRASYERWDGKGEPNRLRGDAIPLVSRLVARRRPR